MANLTSENTSRANGATDEFKSKVQNSDRQLEHAVRQSGEKIGAMASSLVDSTSSYIKSGREYVSENPAKGVAAAAVAGLVVGSLLTWAMRRRD